jgi:2-oxoglutarate ferredoxin oxidoreductase subunit beta
MHPLTVALGSGATFVARVPDTDNDMLFNVLNAAAAHNGVAMVEVLINCVIFNDGVFVPLTDKESRPQTTVKLEAGKPLIFGKDLNKGLRMKGIQPEVVEFAPGNPPSDLIVHDPANPSSGYAFMLAEMGWESGDTHLPVPFGILRQIEDPVYHAHTGQGDDAALEKALRGSGSWVREAE